MCGISGVVTPSGKCDPGRLSEWIARMNGALAHRGPDAEGNWIDTSLGVGLGHRRLAILDLTPLGRQPMASAHERYTVVLNGEIYNYLELKKELEQHGHGFHGGSDTEVALAAFEEWGVLPAVERFNGMFALGVVDRREGMLYLVRDRFGQKPLYYGFVGEDLVFASELKAFMSLPSFSLEIDRDALTLLLRRGCIPAPYSIFKGVAKLPAGHSLSLSLTLGPRGERQLKPVPYWSPRLVAEAAMAKGFLGGFREAEDALLALLKDAVTIAQRSDVPYGVFLSGGVDSSLIAALMCESARGTVRSFSIGFEYASHDEAPHAAAVAKHLGTEHTQLYVTSREAIDLIPRLPEFYDEPFADSSQIPTALLCRLARRDVTVALTGDGGDELFGGYTRYRVLSQFARFLVLPKPLRNLAVAAVKGLSFSQSGRRLSSFLKGAQTVDEVSIHLGSVWKQPAQVVLGAREPETVFNTPAMWPQLASPVRRAMGVDAMGYLPEDILVKVDRAAMAVALETRIPLLDHRVYELVAGFPDAILIPKPGEKRLLRSILKRYVPESLTDRPKQGFDVPLDKWLRGPLRDWMEELIGGDRLAREGYFSPEPILAEKQALLEEGRPRSGYLWPVLMFQAWRQHWRIR
jgi:asparagine synthase (glutamine-hydrolysing)